MKRTDVGASIGMPRCIRFVRREIFRSAQNDRLCVGACIARPNRVKVSKADCFTLTVGADALIRPSKIQFHVKLTVTHQS